MPANKRITDLTDYTSVLPYDSELFGIYHPLIGWKSKRIQDRFTKGLDNDKSDLLKLIQTKFKGLVEVEYRPDCNVQIKNIQPGRTVTGKLKSTNSIVFQKIAEKLPPFENYDEAVWHHVLSDDHLNEIFSQSVIPLYTRYYETLCRGRDGEQIAMFRRFHNQEQMTQAFNGAFKNQLEYESVVAGSFQFLLQHKLFTALKNSFYTVTDHSQSILKVAQALNATDVESAYLNLENLDPRDKDQLSSVLLSPISVVHLFRQYFFELDSFLGTPVGHVWLSPGATVELIEVSTRKTITEKIIETTLETTLKAEKTTTDQDELSEAVKEDNNQDIKFGAGVTASYASITANSSFDLNTSQQRSREQVHKHMRQQTEKLSSEIRKNYKSTFKTVTEVTDMSSKRYLLTNNTNALINYEMRRKMRQVGVQVQDVGTYLCWQCYVDDPGKSIGLSKLIHIAKAPELDAIPHPEEILPLASIPEKKQVSIPFQQTSEDEGDKDEGYRDGREVDEDFLEGDPETVQADFQQIFTAPKSGYTLTSVDVNTNGNSVELSHGPITNDKDTASFNLHLNYVNFRGQDQIQIELTLNWDPDPAMNEEIRKKNEANLAAFKAKEAEAYQKTFVENVKERVKLASKIQQRPSEDLREEERIVVYRHLIQDLLMQGISMPDDRSRHVVAELINSIFDIDKMLYFVAPEWWRPRLHHSFQQLDLTKTPEKKVSPFAMDSSVSIAVNGISKYLNKVKGDTTSNLKELRSSTVGWGGVDDDNRDNYYITEDSDPAKLGSSLGWLMQLDGDNLRNAFLNAPWVKAVIPIRPGKEVAAINWLKGVEGFNGIDDAAIYHASSPDEKDSNGNPLEGQKMVDVLFDLAKKVQVKHQKEVEVGTYPKAGDVADPALVDESTTITSTPIDRVYEHGFFPLQGGFRAHVKDNFEIFDQWLEILPTDQVVPVEVKYDPKTGRQI